MSDDHLEDRLHAYADRVGRTGSLPSPSAIRGKARARHQRRVVGATFGVVLLGTLGIGLALDRDGLTPAPTPPAVVSPAPTPSIVPTSTPSRTPASSPTNTVVSDVSQLEDLGIDLDQDVLIDVADDGLDRYLGVDGDVVDFTGTGATANTTVALRPAKVARATEETRNQVVIALPAYGTAGSCVADTAPRTLRVSACGDTAEVTWTVVPAGDSGQFELHGAHTQIRVDAGRLTDGQGYVGLQTLTLPR